ncbi:MAG TPA: M13 family metallopeptidase [Holophaga sp.]|nr:M13 family metallopeptidase [Holophaga sp.]
MSRSSSFLHLGFGILTTCLVASSLTAQDLPKPGHGLRPADMDTAVKPCDDFFQFANGSWLNRTKIPAEYANWGAFMEIREHNLETLKVILEDVSKRSDWPKGSIQQKVGDFYAMGMDEARIEREGIRPLAPAFQRIAKIKNVKDLVREIAILHRQGVNAAFGFGVGQDDKDSAHYIAQIAQGGLGLPDRDYYTKDDAKSVELRAKYEAHVTRMFELLGDKPAAAQAHAKTVMTFETRLAKASMTRVEQRDPNAIYHKLTRAEIEQGGSPWKAYFEAVGLPSSEKDLLVRQPAFLQELGALTKEVSLKDWKTYLRWHLINANATELSKPFVNEHFAFFGKTLNGTQALSPRWKRIQGATDQALGEALGQLYVEKAFKPEAKQKALTLVANLRAALRDRIQKLDWMNEATKVKAIQKLDAFRVKIGYPDTWRDYSKLDIKRQSYVLNSVAAAEFEFQRGLDKLGKPLDLSEWGMTPSTVNAYYNPNMNEIVFPAGILQAPFFDAEADDAVNYGGIGLVIGHEMTHGFDDEGRQFDADGNLKDWWTEADAKAYDARAELVVKQYDGYEALPGLKLNGKLTLGENIADLGGLKIAYTAFLKSLEGKAKPAPVDGFTAEQRFFLGYAQSWRFTARDESARLRVMTDPHSPARFRVLGPLSNMPEFFQAFGCGENAPMVRPAALRPTIW